MPRPCSDDLRMRAGKKAMAGKSRRSFEKQFRVAASTVIERFQRYSDKEKSRVAGGVRTRRPWCTPPIE